MTPPKRWAEWRDYRTASNVRVVLKEFRVLSDNEYANIRAGMDEVATIGMSAARHVRGDIYEVRSASESSVAVRVLFATEGRRRKILPRLSVFKKRARKTPRHEIEKAEPRLRDWRSRATPGGAIPLR